MRNLRWLLLTGVLAALFFGGATPAAAHNTGPLKTFPVHIGPYPATVNYYSNPRGGQALQFTIVPDRSVRGPLHYQVTAVPGTSVDAVPVKAVLEPDVDNPAGTAGRVNLPVSGQWLLSVDVAGPLGPGAGDVPILAGAPPAMPEWLGWLIGLLPVWAILGFILAQARRAGRGAPVPAAA